jgi:hypothetical protein
MVDLLRVSVGGESITTEELRMEVNDIRALNPACRRQESAYCDLVREGIRSNPRVRQKRRITDYGFLTADGSTDIRNEEFVHHRLHRFSQIILRQN